MRLITVDGFELSVLLFRKPMAGPISHSQQIRYSILIERQLNQLKKYL